MDFPSAMLDFPNRFRCRHVVDAGVKPQFAEQQYATFPRFGVERPDVVVEIRDIDHVDPMFEARLSDVSNHGRGKQVDDQVGSCGREQLVEPFPGVARERRCFCVSGGYRGRMILFLIGDKDMAFRLVEEIPDAGRRYPPGAKYERFLQGQYLPSDVSSSFRGA